jgi:hypothetical protein
MSTALEKREYGGALIVTYAALASESGEAFESYKWPDKTVQAYGTGTVTVEGSNDGTHWVALNDLSGSPISLAAASSAASVILENPIHMRATVSGGTALVVITASR